MHRIIVIFFVLSAATAAHGQVTGTAVPIPIPNPVPSYVFSTSALDHNGNLLVFDVSYSQPTLLPGQPIILRLPPAIKTRVTVVTSDGTRMTPVDYEGAFQVLGAGWHAIYAIASAYTVAGSSIPLSGAIAFSASRRLIALNVIAGVPLTPLPAVDVPIRAEVKLSAATDRTLPDTISFLDAVQSPLMLNPADTATLRAATRNAQIVKYSGGAKFDVGQPVALP